MAEIGKNSQKKFLVLTGIVISFVIVTAIFFFLILPPGGNMRSESTIPGSEQSPHENQSDLVMPLFRVTESPNDTVKAENWSADGQFAEAPSPEECPSYAKKALEPYGGMPRDAVFDSVKEGSHACIGDNLGEKCFVTSRRIVYRQKPYNVAIHGTAGGLSIELTAGGLPSTINKKWLTLEEVGIVHVIPASDAMTRLRLGEGKNIPPDPLELTILSMEPGFYAPENGTNASYLEPVWAINARDEIQKKALNLYVPAGKTPAQVEFSPVSGPGIAHNFTGAGGTIPRPDVSTASHVYVGTSGPVGEDAARESIRNFTANSSIALDYHGQSSRQNEGCGGQNYNWVFYDFTSGSCEFYVDTYTGSVIYAITDPNCTSTGIPVLPSLAMKSPEDATKKVSEFLHEKYLQYDKRHIVYNYREMPDSYHKDIGYAFNDDNTNIDLSFDPAEGRLTHYAVYNSNLVGKCAGSPEIVVFAVTVMILLYRRKQ
jgi:hypothetical protein